MRKTLFVIGVALLIAVAGFLYYTRPVPAPSNAATPSAESVFGAQQQNGEELYRIVSTESRAQFVIDETLNGKPVRVVGTTDQVTGEILFNAENPSNSRMSEVRVNARTLKTDNERRDGALSRLILKSSEDAFEFIVFQATGIIGMPASLPVASSTSVKIAGNLTVRGVTRSVMFDGTLRRETESTLSGTVQTTIAYADFGLSIPKLSFLAWVDDTVQLQLEFVAKK
jgi:polyisoprenoid-binding protein YceI